MNWWKEIFFCITELIAFCCSIVGNLIVLHAFAREKKSWNKSKIHMVAVAVVDLMITVFATPFGILMVNTYDK